MIIALVITVLEGKSIFTNMTFLGILQPGLVIGRHLPVPIGVLLNLPPWLDIISFMAAIEDLHQFPTPASDNHPVWPTHGAVDLD